MKGTCYDRHRLGARSAVGCWGVIRVVRTEPGDAGHDQPMRLTLLGGFGLMKGAEEVGLPLSAQRLVALLALRGRPLSRGCLAGVLWSEYSVKRSMADLRTALWRANHAGVPVVSTLGMRLHLAAEVEVDVRMLLEFIAAPGSPARARTSSPGRRGSISRWSCCPTGTTTG